MREQTTLEKALRQVQYGDTLELVREGHIYHFTRRSRRFSAFTVIVDGRLIESRPIFQPKLIISWLEENAFLK